MTPGHNRLLFNANAAWFFISHRLPVALAARDAGYEVHLAAAIESEAETATISREGFVFHRVPLRRGALNPVFDLNYMVHLAAIIRRVRPELIHNVTVKPIIYGSLAARALAVPSIVNAVSGLGYSFSGGGRRRLLANIVRLGYRFALRTSRSRVIFQNPDDAREFVEAGIVTPTQVCLIRGSGVDLDAFQYSSQPDGVPQVVLPARMVRDKGVIEFARAAQLLLSNGITARFLLAGMIDEGNPAGLRWNELQRLQQETGVEWLGHVNNMAALYRRASVVCLPSYREGLPKALIEACAAGRAIVTTDVPGCREVVTDGVNGLLARPRDVSSLAGALGKLLLDPTLRARLGEAGRRRAETEFDSRLVVRATLQVYQELLAS